MRNIRNVTSIYWITFLIGLVWLLIVAIRSPDAAFLDEIGHVLMSQNVWHYPSFLLNLWGRPFNTFIYAIPSLGGLLLARWFSVGIAILIVWITTKIADKMDIKHLWLIPLLLFFQPWFTEWIYTANTMTPLTLLIVSGIYLWMSGRWDWASLLFGLLPLTRHEGIALLVIWAVYCLIQKRFVASIISFIPVFIYNLIYYMIYGVLASGIFLRIQPTTFYGSGDWFHYLPDILQGVGLILLPISIIGMAILLKHAWRVIFIPFAMYLVIHIVIYRFGLFASGGYGAFLVPLSPLFALCGAAGVIWLTQQSKPKHRNLIWFALIYAIVFYALLTTLVHPYTPRTIALKDASEWIKQNEPLTPVLSSHVWFVYFHDLSWSPNSTDGYIRSAVELDALPVDTIIVHEFHFSERFGINYDYLSQSDTWQTLKTFSEGVNLVTLFKKVN